MQPIRIAIYCPTGVKIKTVEITPNPNSDSKFFREKQIEALNTCVMQYGLKVACRNDFAVLAEDGHLLKVKNPQ